MALYKFRIVMLIIIPVRFYLGENVRKWSPALWNYIVRRIALQANYIFQHCVMVSQTFTSAAVKAVFPSHISRTYRRVAKQIIITMTSHTFEHKLFSDKAMNKELW